MAYKSCTIEIFLKKSQILQYMYVNTQHYNRSQVKKLTFKLYFHHSQQRGMERGIFETQFLRSMGKTKNLHTLRQ